MENHGSLPARGTQPYQLLALTAISGEFPAALLARLPGGASYKEAIVGGLKKNRLLHTYYRDGLRAYRLSAKAKALLLAEQPERFQFYLTGNADTNLLKSEISRRLRLHQIAGLYLTMLLAGVQIYRDEKPQVFAPEGSPVATLAAPAFYSSREVKELGLESVKIRGARIAGVLLASTGVFVVYNSGSALMKWGYLAEMRVKALLKMVLCQQRLASQYQMEDVNSILFGDGMALAYEILTSNDRGKRNYFVLDSNFDHFYFLTNDHQGEVLLKLICNPDKAVALNEILLQGLNEKEPGWPIENDAIDVNGNPVLLAYLFDMPRIVRFCSALSLQGRRGILICFEFQSDSLRRYCGDLAEIQTISLEKLERRFFP